MVGWPLIWPRWGIFRVRSNDKPLRADRHDGDFGFGFGFGPKEKPKKKEKEERKEIRLPNKEKSFASVKLQSNRGLELRLTTPIMTRFTLVEEERGGNKQTKRIGFDGQYNRDRPINRQPRGRPTGGLVTAVAGRSTSFSSKFPHVRATGSFEFWRAPS